METSVFIGFSFGVKIYKIVIYLADDYTEIFHLFKYMSKSKYVILNCSFFVLLLKKYSRSSAMRSFFEIV